VGFEPVLVGLDGSGADEALVGQTRDQAEGISRAGRQR
jgi:hypothetical protein